jgi:hypothetical protein
MEIFEFGVLGLVVSAWLAVNHFLLLPSQEFTDSCLGGRFTQRSESIRASPPHNESSSPTNKDHIHKCQASFSYSSAMSSPKTLSNDFWEHAQNDRLLRPGERFVSAISVYLVIPCLGNLLC